MDVFSYMEKRRVNLEEVFNVTTNKPNTNLDLESLMRKLGHNMEKKGEHMVGHLHIRDIPQREYSPKKVEVGCPPE